MIFHFLTVPDGTDDLSFIQKWKTIRSIIFNTVRTTEGDSYLIDGAAHEVSATAVAARGHIKTIKNKKCKYIYEFFFLSLDHFGVSSFRF